MNHRMRPATKAFGSGPLNSDPNDDPRRISYNKTATLESPSSRFTLQMLPGEPSSGGQQADEQSRLVSNANDMNTEVIAEENTSQK